MWTWPNDAQLAVATLIHLDGGQAQHDGRAPDLHYGHHAGFARLARLLQEHEHPASWVQTDHRLQQLPQIAGFIAARGDGLLATPVAADHDADEASQIELGAGLLAGSDSPRGWYGHPMQSERTAALLVANGFDHVIAASPLDLPFHLEVPDSPGLIVQPLLQELSDLQLLGAGAVTPEHWLQALIDSVDVLMEEAQDSGEPRQLSLELHLPVIARPSRIRALEQFLNYLGQLDGVLRSTPAAIAALVRATE